MLLGYFLERGVGPKPRGEKRPKSQLLSAREYWLFCAMRCFSALQSINWMLEKDRGVDAMPLIRAIYESYLHMRYTAKHPEKVRDIVDAKVGLERGTHAFAKTSKGTPDRRTILDLNTGEKFEGHISVYRMAESSSVPSDATLFPYFYEYLSGFVHPSFQLLPDYSAHGDSLSSTHDGRVFEACCYAITAASMVLDFIRTSTLASASMEVDLRTVLRRISKRVVMLLRKEVKGNASALDREVLLRWEEIRKSCE